MIWILAFLCLFGAASIGYTQGPIRGIFALAGLFAAALLAGPVGQLIKPVVMAFGCNHPITLRAVPPVIAFIIVWTIFQLAGIAVHNKIVTYHKYKEDDAEYFKWERIYQRLGTCLGLFCGGVFFLILLHPIYVAGYFTTQFAPGEDAGFKVRFINKIRADMCRLKLDRVVAQFDPVPPSIYEASDLLAVILANRELVPRLASYPLCLTLAESPQFHDLVNDPDFLNKYKANASVIELLKNPKVADVVKNPVVFSELFDLVSDNMADLKTYIYTGVSPKYSQEKILGHWVSNPYATYQRQRVKFKNASASAIVRARWNIINYATGFTLTVTPNNVLTLKRADSAEGLKPLANGSWKNDGANYQLTLPDNKPDCVSATITNNQLLFEREDTSMVFDHED